MQPGSSYTKSAILERWRRPQIANKCPKIRDFHVGSCLDTHSDPGWVIPAVGGGWWGNRGAGHWPGPLAAACCPRSVAVCGLVTGSGPDCGGRSECHRPGTSLSRKRHAAGAEGGGTAHRQRLARGCSCRSARGTACTRHTNASIAVPHGRCRRSSFRSCRRGSSS